MANVAISSTQSSKAPAGASTDGIVLSPSSSKTKDRKSVSFAEDPTKDVGRPTVVPILEPNSSGPMCYIRSAVAQNKIIGDWGHEKSTVLAKIVHHLKRRFETLEGPCTFDQLLVEIKATDIAPDTKKYLLNKALPEHPKVEVTDDQKYVFKSPLPCRDYQELLRYLKKYGQETGGGILQEDIADSVSCADTILRLFANKGILTIITREDQKEVVFFNRRSDPKFTVDEEFKELYHSIDVSKTDSKAIEGYLRSSGLKPLMEAKGNRFSIPKGSKGASRVRKPRSTIAKIPKDNIHVADQLKNYRDGLDEKGMNPVPRCSDSSGNKQPKEAKECKPKTETSKSTLKLRDEQLQNDGGDLDEMKKVRSRSVPTGVKKPKEAKDLTPKTAAPKSKPKPGVDQLQHDDEGLKEVKQVRSRSVSTGARKRKEVTERQPNTGTPTSTRKPRAQKRKKMN